MFFWNNTEKYQIFYHGSFFGLDIWQYLNIAISKAPINSKTSNAIITDMPRNKLIAPPICENKPSAYKRISSRWVIT